MKFQNTFSIFKHKKGCLFGNPGKNLKKEIWRYNGAEVNFFKNQWCISYAAIIGGLYYNVFTVINVKEQLNSTCKTWLTLNSNSL